MNSHRDQVREKILDFHARGSICLYYLLKEEDSRKMEENRPVTTSQEKYRRSRAPVTVVKQRDLCSLAQTVNTHFQMRLCINSLPVRAQMLCCSRFPTILYANMEGTWVQKVKEGGLAEQIVQWGSTHTVVACQVVLFADAHKSFQLFTSPG